MPNTNPIKRRTLLGFALTQSSWFASSSLADTLGTKPNYIKNNLSNIPNQQAILKTIWAPGLDDGFVPQGLTYFSDHVLSAGYQSTDPKINSGLCRIFNVSADNGQTIGYFDMPAECGHAGGLTMINDRELVVSDTRALYKINLVQALAFKNTSKALLSVVKLGGALKGTFVDFDGKDLWIGSYEKDLALSKAYRLSLGIFDRYNQRPAIKEHLALSSVPIPALANGMAFDANGAMWLATSNSKAGALHRLNAKTGEVTARFDMVSGLEDLSFDAQGALWAVSEAGSQRWSNWATTFPLIFQVNVALLK
jgi:hypothetical protein